MSKLVLCLRFWIGIYRDHPAKVWYFVWVFGYYNE